jgi:hypothetical protein
MFIPGLAFVSTSSQTSFRTLVRVLIYGHIVHISSCFLVLISRYERVAIVGNFYTEDAYAITSGEINLLITTTIHDNKKHMVDHIMKGFIYSSLYSDCVLI